MRKKREKWLELKRSLRISVASLRQDKQKMAFKIIILVHVYLVPTYLSNILQAESLLEPYVGYAR